MKELFLIAALGLPQVTTHNTTFKDADAAFFSMLRAMSPSGYIGFTVYDELPRIITHIPSGGFLLIDGPYGRVLEYFRGRDFERLPFTWKDRHVYRRQVGGAA